MFAAVAACTPAASSPNTYRISFYDGATLLDTVYAEEGTVPVYSGMPQRAPSEDTVYTFSGWEPQLQAATEDAVYTAKFSESDRYYCVKFGNDPVYYKYGEKLTKPKDPTKEEDENYTYTFAGWYNGDEEWDFHSDTVTQDVTLTPRFTRTDKNTGEQEPPAQEDELVLIESGQNVHGGEIVYTLAGENTSFAKTNIQNAANELKNWLSTITGAQFALRSVDKPASFTPDAQKTYLIIGDALASSVSGLNCDAISTDTGYALRREGNCIFMYGRTSYGDAQAVYGFLNRFTGLKFYAEDVFTYNSVSDVKVGELNDSFDPDFNYAYATDGILRTDANGGSVVNWEYQQRLGFVTDWYVDLQLFFSDILPSSQYAAAHPGWYTTANGAEMLNLSYNNYEMVPAFAQELAQTILADTTLRSSYCICPPDIRGWSETEESLANKEKYGTDAAEFVIFMNKVAEYLDDNYTFARNVNLMFLAYHATEKPPAGEEFKLYSGEQIQVGVFYCPINMSFYRDMTDSTHVLYQTGNTNSYYAQQFADWAALAEDTAIYFWNYSSWFTNYFVPLNTVSSMQSRYQYAKSLGAEVIKDMGNITDDVTPDWAALKVYLKSVLSKDAAADIESETENFFKAYYGAAWSEMLTLFETENAWAETVCSRSTATGETYGQNQGFGWLKNTYMWDEGERYLFGTRYDSSMMKNWYAYIERALQKAGNNSVLKERIMLEGLPIRYLCAWVYEDFSLGTIDDIIEDAKELGVSNYGENRPIDGLAAAKG